MGEATARQSPNCSARRTFLGMPTSCQYSEESSPGSFQSSRGASRGFRRVPGEEGKKGVKPSGLGRLFAERTPRPKAVKPTGPAWVSSRQVSRRCPAERASPPDRAGPDHRAEPDGALPAQPSPQGTDAGSPLRSRGEESRSLSPAVRSAGRAASPLPARCAAPGPCGPRGGASREGQRRRRATRRTSQTDAERAAERDSLSCGERIPAGKNARGSELLFDDQEPVVFGEALAPASRAG